MHPTKTILASISILAGILAAVSTLESQRLRRDLDIANTARAAALGEAEIAWRHVHELRATLAALDGPQPDPAVGMQFLDN